MKAIRKYVRKDKIEHSEQKLQEKRKKLSAVNQERTDRQTATGLKVVFCEISLRTC